MRGWIVGACALAVTSCGSLLPDPGRGDRLRDDVGSIRADLTAGETASPEQPRPYANAPVTLTVRIEVDGLDGRVLTDFDDWVSVSLAPGVLVGLAADDASRVQGRSVKLANGVAEGIRVTFTRAYGEMRVQAEDTGYTPIPAGTVAGCSNGLDDDHDGRIDYPADYGCAGPNDDSERGGSYALGATVPVFFAQPTLYDVQGGAATSPLVNERIGVNRGTLIVTRTSVSGLWVTDIADTSCNGQPCYNSLFAFNFGLPSGLRPCDRLSLLQGTVQEFVSTTQLTQPSWTIADDGLWIDTMTSGACRIPDAVPITSAALADTVNVLEPLESSIVRATNVKVSLNVGPGRVTCSPNCIFSPGNSNCDQNGDAAIDFTNAAEATCSNACSITRGCSEWNSWTKYGQIAVDFVDHPTDSVPRLVIAMHDTVTDYDPQRPPDWTQQPVTITGTLTQAGPTWIVEPRCTADIATAGASPLPPNASCVFPRSDPEDQ